MISCKKNQESKIIKEDESLFNVVKTYQTGDVVKSKYRKNIEDWDELRTLDLFLERFKKSSPNGVLSNALELEVLVKRINYSIKPEVFNIPSFNTRVNILHNEALRLSDMTNIPSIKAEEINSQAEKIVLAFSAMNAKINTILSKKEFEDAIKIDAVFIGLDSTKIDSISRKSIEKNLEDQEISRNN
jgi:hypothetical protein